MIRVASYNMRKAIGTDRRRNPERILEVLGEIDADVIALQEADRRFGERAAVITPHLLDRHSDWKAVDLGERTVSMGWHGNALLVRKTAHVLTGCTIKLPALEPRGAVSAKVAVGDRTLHVIGMHLDLSGLWRRKQAAAILSHVEDLAPGGDTVMMGDLNEWTSAAGCLRDFGRDFAFADTGPSFHARPPVGRRAQGQRSSADMGRPVAGMIREIELRLALVCYGGISLAVYMHGITKEVWHAARASRAAHERITLTGSAQVYAALIESIAQDSAMRLRVLPDIVAGASAGGINGIFLAQAISAGQSLDPLTDLWLERADVEALIAPDVAPASRFSKAWAMPLAWMAAGRSAEKLDGVDERTREEVRAKLSHFVRSRWFEPPFDGPGFTAMLLDAFDAMANAPRGPRLLPDGQPLDLFVTVTDFTGHPERLELHSPPEVVETEHRLVLAFTDHGLPCDTLAAAPELTFAARATSSFPGAFPAFTVKELDGVLAERDRSWPTRGSFLGTALPRHAAANAADRAVLIDGSVLANAPFRPAIDALAQRPARRQVDRRFVYVDPSPGMKFRLTSGTDATPGFFQTILGAVSELPRKQPIRDNLDAIAARSHRIERMRRITAAIRPQVEAEVEALFGRTFFLDRPTPARLVAWRRRAQIAAAERAGFSYAGYAHLKINGVVETITALLHAIGGEPGPERWRGIRARIEAALMARGYDEARPSDASSDASIAFLRTFDLGFRVRRLRLLARRLVELEGEHDEAALRPIRDAIYTSLSAYLDCNGAKPHRALRGLVRRRSGDIAELLDRLAASMDLTRLDAETDERLAEAFAALPREPRRALLLRYLGFPYLDLATLPLLQGEGIDEYDPIKVDRISPDDATAIRGGGAEATLKGIQFSNFGAFFSRAYRENDYLWGRLHGAERMIDIIVSALPADTRLRPGQVAAAKRAAFVAILDEEEVRLSTASALIAQLRTEIG
jgi:patatin-related protein